MNASALAFGVVLIALIAFVATVAVGFGPVLARIWEGLPR